MLSKTRILNSLQCLKRVHLEVNRPDLAQPSPKAETAFAIGHQVGALARRIYDSGGGTVVEYSGGSLAPALQRTQELMAERRDAPLFEATLSHGDVLVREDVLLPVDADGRQSWRLVEVKASTQVKPEHLADCAIQAWVHMGAGFPLSAVSLAHVNNAFVYAGDGSYEGILVEHELSGEIEPLLAEVPHWVAAARQAVEGATPEVPVGAHCTKPYECPFMDHCWPNDVRYPISGLGGSRKKLGEWVARGYRDIRDVPASEITSDQQARIHRITTTGAAEMLPGAREFATALPYPRFYLDFETVGPPIPIWAGTRPYQAQPFQWSCHVEREPGALEHREFLDLSGAPPMRALTESMIDALEVKGPILVYTSFEAGVIRGLQERFPDLAVQLQAIRDRLVDLHPVTRQNYYHPDMLGSWSIKAVLPTIAPDLDYSALSGIQEGTEASAAYLEAIASDTTPERRHEIEVQLLDYCRMDTQAMVRLMHVFAGDE